MYDERVGRFWGKAEKKIKEITTENRGTKRTVYNIYIVGVYIVHRIVTVRLG